MEVLQPPDFEVRADQFIQRVVQLAQTEFKDSVYATAENTGLNLLHGTDMLRHLLGENIQPDAAMLLNQVGDEVDRKTANESQVEVWAQSYEEQTLLQFVRGVYALADKNGGKPIPDPLAAALGVEIDDEVSKHCEVGTLDWDESPFIFSHYFTFS